MAVLLSCYRSKTQHNVHPSTMRDLKALFRSGQRLTLAGITDHQDRSTTEITEAEAELIQADVQAYHTLSQGWAPLTSIATGDEDCTANEQVVDAQLVAEATSTNPVLGHVLHQLIEAHYPDPQPWQPAPLPQCQLRAVVLGKPFAGKSTALAPFSSSQDVMVISPTSVTNEALQAFEQREQAEGTELALEQVLPPELSMPLRADRLSQAQAYFNEFEADMAGQAAEVEAQAQANTAAATIENSVADAAQQDDDDHDDKPDDVAGGDDNETNCEAESEGHGPDDSSLETPPAVDSTSQSIKSVDSEAAKSEDSCNASPRLSLRAQLGKLVRDDLAEGKVVDERVVCALIALAVRRASHGAGWILDGYPTTVEQAQLLERCLGGRLLPCEAGLNNKRHFRSKLAPPPQVDEEPLPEARVQMVILLEPSDEVVIGRALGRRLDPTTGQEYHLTNTPPPVATDPEQAGMIERLTTKEDASFEAQQLHARLEAWHEHSADILDFYSEGGSAEGRTQLHVLDDDSASAAEMGQAIAQLVEQAKHEQEERAVQAAERIAQAAEMHSQALAEIDTVLIEQSEQEGALHPPKPSPPSSLSPSDGTVAELSRPQSRKKSAKTTRPASKAGKKGGKGSKTPAAAPADSEDAVPTASELDEAAKEGDEAVKAAVAEVTVAPPKPGDADYMFCPLDGLDTVLARGVVPAWDQLEDSYVAGIQTVAMQLRSERQRVVEFTDTSRTAFAAFVARPDSKQEYVSQFQETFNELSDDVRASEAGQNELFQRLEELKDTLYDISDKRKEDAETELTNLKTNLWLEDKTAVLLNCHLQLMQGELDRYTTATNIVQDVYGNLTDRLQTDSAGTPPPIPLIDPATSVDALGKSRGRGKAAAVATVPGPEGVPVTPHVAASNQQTFKAVVDSLLAYVPARADPAVYRAEQAELKRQQEQEAAEAAAAAAAKAKKGKKGAEPVVEESSEPSAEDIAEQARVQAAAALKTRREDEEYAALLLEDNRFKARIRALQRLAQHETGRLADIHGKLVSELDDMLGEQYKQEIKAIDVLCSDVSKAIRDNVKIAHVLQLAGTKYDIRTSHYSYKPAKQPLPPPPVEAQPTNGAFTVEQAQALYNELIAIAPSGHIPCADFSAVLARLALQEAKINALPPSWQSLTQAALQDKAQQWCQGSAYVSIKQAIIDALALPAPTAADMIAAYRECYAQNTRGTVTAAQFAKVALWFDTPRPTPDDNTLALQFHRSARVRELLFDMFADDCLSYYARELSYYELLFHLCRCEDVKQGLNAAMALCACHTQRQALSMDAELVDVKSCNLTEAMLLLRTCRPVAKVAEDGRVEFQEELDKELMQSLMEMAAAEANQDDPRKAPAESLFLSEDTPPQLMGVAAFLQRADMTVVSEQE
eukprot:TRINITY_DN11598_c0_g2_i1.p1 TRINITY_DN11598_c0_g2~~TRINITY_DN11598_c0_g2_i1.p1  ORF type:complete len:1535 (+),score=487.54 TRINITY_DN11598_c0_g2_i1:407-4606(+)